MKKYIRFHGGIFLLFFLLGIFITYPLIFHLGDLSTGMGDELLIAWINKWVIHILSSHPTLLFQAPSFYPYQHALAFSETFVTSSILFALPALFIKEPIAFVNVDLIGSLVLLGFSCYLLTQYFVKNRLLAVLAGTMVMFSPVVLDKYVHLQVLLIFFVPLSYLLFFYFLRTKKAKFFIAVLICFILQTYNSFLPGYFILFGLAIQLLFYILEKRRKSKWLLNKKYFILGIIALALVIPFTLPYYSVSQTFNYKRDIREAIHLSIQPEDLLYTYQFSHLAPFFSWLQHPQTYPAAVSFKNGFPGLVLSILIIFSLVVTVKSWRKLSYEKRSLFGIGMTGLVLSFGPFLHIARHTIHHPFPIPLPYAVLYYILPGFNGMRNAARWEMVFIIALSVVSVITLQELTKSLSSKRKLILCLVLLLGVMGEYDNTFHFTQIPQQEQFPQEYQWLNTTAPSSVVVEMPIYNWNTFPYATEELLRQYYMTANFRRTMNGASGFSPPPWQVLVNNILAGFPSSGTITKLKELRVNYIVVHLDDYDRLNKDNFQITSGRAPNGQRIAGELSKSKQIMEVQRYPLTRIYKIL